MPVIRCKRIIFLIVLTLSASLLFPGEAKEIFKTDTPPVLDGKLDDPAWESALKVTGFKTFQPDYGKDPHYRTIAYAVYDKENLYIGYRCYDSSPKKIKATVTKRDNMFEEDFASIILDTFNDKQGGYGFMVNPFGVQGDGMMDMNGSLDASHDMVWYSAKELSMKRGTLSNLRFPLKASVSRAVKKLPWESSSFARRCAIRNMEVTREYSRIRGVFSRKVCRLYYPVSSTNGWWNCCPLLHTAGKVLPGRAN